MLRVVSFIASKSSDSFSAVGHSVHLRGFFDLVAEISCSSARIDFPTTMHCTRIAVFLFFAFSLVSVLTAAEDKSTIRTAIDKITEDWGSGRTSSEGCIWKGTSPFCDGGCNVVGHVVRQTSATGDGEKCLTGLKVLCCPSSA